MNEEFEYNGYWWLPEKPDEPACGQLKFIFGRGLVLELLGTIHDDPLNPDADFNPPIILGLTDTRKYITLHNCKLIQTKSNIPGFSTSSLIADRAFIGTHFGPHFKTTEEIKFKSLSVHYAHLDEWANKPGLDVDHSEEDKGKLTVRYEQPEPVQTEVSGYEIAIVAGHGLSFNRIKEARITQRAWVRFTSGEERSLEDYLDIVADIRDFLSLAMTKPTYPLAMQGTSQASKKVAKDGKDLYFPFEVIYQVPFLPAELGVLHRQDILFTLPDIQDQFKAYVSNWVSKADLLGPVYGLYFSTLYNPNMYLESQFLGLAQAIETYHRRSFGGEYQSDAEYRDGLYKEFVKVIPPELDTGFKDHLKRGPLKYANQFSLRKRLREIADRLSPRFAIEFIGSEEYRDNFVEKVVDTRNYLTHYDPDLRDRAAQDQELYDLIQKLKALLEICLLEELGLSLDAIRDMTFKHRRYKYVFQLR